ncbi:hypothetical protein DICSQDRAFT_148436 [Dichomitus squalens LYAD-421 SS1]|uniref:CST complex subunit STN1 n=1 Tax=Dichomitus squalens (strain LYAD-421) TaxID=732165 RepID=R7SX17_DICSQ|nr:uncharacterized protein DICSQDRAFT_148436 [Dichomitus squalens LYAD-421 SS1]EJF59537.1 hypothetical protein DICSQDRAFT_148436 [Dichomitus squalens LYAD-421 SS1]
MSHTSTVPQTRTAISRSPSILLTPSKRRKLNAEKPKQTAPPTEKEAEQPQPTPADILRWTFTRAAVTSCFVRDVFEMKQSGIRDMDYFWLGRIPCRTVRLLGLVVGVAVWDKRTVYTLDDGTAILDCALAHAQLVPPSPVKPKAKATAPASDATSKKAGLSFSDYLFSACKVATTASSSIHTRAEPPPPPEPVARVGQSVQVVGRVVSRHDTRILLVDEISRCASYNDEPSHWLAVSELHRTTYYPSEPSPPFIPPPLPTHPTFLALSRPNSPSKRATVQKPTTPAFVRSIAPSTNTSPSTSVASSSPTSSTAGDVKANDTQAPRLRHPSRLHTRDLTANTFRIYVKHYMDNAPPPPRKRHHPTARSASPTPPPRATRRVRDMLNTPTKSRSCRTDASTDKTPRPRGRGEDRTPRASRRSHVENDTDAECDDEDDQMYGYTLSHLRRVPELSLLARRVIAADAHRRAKEERKNAKAAPPSIPSDKGKAKVAAPPSSSSASGASKGPTAAAVKKLFKQAIRTLFTEGDIVLWSGPVCPPPAPAPTLDPFLSSYSSSSSSAAGLWRASTSTSSAISAHSRPSYEEWDDDAAELSDPQPGEEAYVPLTPAYFSRVLEDAIRRMAQEKIARAGVSEATPKPKPSASRSQSIIERLRAQEREKELEAPPGPTKEELLAWLRNTDERWARVGEWTVQEALEWGRREGRLWCVGKGRWEVCG